MKQHLLYTLIMKNSLLPLSILFIVGLLFSCGTESTPVYTLTTSVNGEGTITPLEGEFDEGEMVTLTGTPKEGWIFSGWEGDWSSTENPTSVTMNSDRNIIGVFERKNYPLNISIEGKGTVEERIVSQSKTTDYPFETVVELTPVPDPGWEFEEWSGDVSSTEEVIEVTIVGEKNITVKFSDPIFLGENGVTIMCPNGQVGDIGVVNGIEYEIVDRNLLLQRKNEGSDLTKVCVSIVTDMSLIFDNSTFNQPIGNWDVSNVTDMSKMFSYSEFNESISDWDVSNVTNMDRMFWRSQFNQPIGDWNVKNVTDMGRMFWGSQFNQPIGNWNVSNVTNMGRMFFVSQFNQPIGDWDVSSVTNMSWMFRSSQFNQSISNWDVSSVTTMNNMFEISQFNQPIGDWDVSSVTDMSSIFRESQFNQPIGDWDVSSVTNMNFMFWESPFNHPIGNWDVRNVTDMWGMLSYTPFNQNISGWCVSQFTTEPDDFSTDSPLTEENKPVWGTCPD